MEGKVLKERLILKKSVRKFINQVFVSCIILLVSLISIKKNPEIKNNIIKYVYEDSIDFIKIKNIYDNYFGKVIPTIISSKEEAVFNEKINYYELEEYNNGVKLKVENNYFVPVLKEGIVVFIGEKEGLGKTVIVEQTDGTDVFYSNLENVNVNIYDYVDSNDYIGNVNNELILLFQKEGNIIDYKTYL